MDRPLYQFAPDKIWKGPAVKTAGLFLSTDSVILRSPKDEGSARPGIGFSKTAVTDTGQNTGENLVGCNLG